MIDEGRRKTGGKKKAKKRKEKAGRKICETGGWVLLSSYLGVGSRDSQSLESRGEQATAEQVQSTSDPESLAWLEGG